MFETIGCTFNSNQFVLTFSYKGATCTLVVVDAYKELTLSVNGSEYTLLFDDNAVYDGLFPEEYLGVWSTEKGDYVIEVKDNSIIINGETVTDIEVEISGATPTDKWALQETLYMQQ